MDELGSELVALVRALREVAPEVWQIAVRQVTVQAVLGLLWTAVGLLGSVGSWKLAVSLWRKHKENEYEIWDMGAAFSFVLAVFFVGLTIMALAATLPRIINPQWYAIELLRNLLPR